MSENITKTKEQKTARLKNQIWIYLNVYGKIPSKDSIKDLFFKLCLFKPAKMGVSVGCRNDYKRYNEEIFLNTIYTEDRVTLEITDKTGCDSIFARIDNTSSRFEIRMPMEIWKSRKEELIKIYEKLFSDFGGCFGFVVNAFDYGVVQNPGFTDDYERYEVDDSDYTDIEKIPLLPEIFPLGKRKIDVSHLPGHKKYYNSMEFTTAPYMWFGSDFCRFFSFEKLETFNDCEENIEFLPGFRRICLWRDISEYNAPIYRRRQWNFRKEIEMDLVLNELSDKPFIPKDESSISDPTMELKRGEFVHGGDLLVTFYLDEKGRACLKSKACAYVQHEIKNNEIIWKERKKL